MPVIRDVTTSNGANCLPLSPSTASLPYTLLKIVLYIESYFYRIYATREAPKGIRKASAELNEALWSTKAKPQKLFWPSIENVRVCIHSYVQGFLHLQKKLSCSQKKPSNLQPSCTTNVLQSKEKHFEHFTDAYYTPSTPPPTSDSFPQGNTNYIRICFWS